MRELIKTMLVLFLQVKGSNPDDLKRFNKIKMKWYSDFIMPRIKDIKHKQSNPLEISDQNFRERITVEHGQHYFAVFSWLKKEVK